METGDFDDGFLLKKTYSVDEEDERGTEASG